MSAEEIECILTYCRTSKYGRTWSKFRTAYGLVIWRSRRTMEIGE